MPSNLYPKDPKVVDLTVYRDALAKSSEALVAVSPEMLVTLIDSIFELKNTVERLEDDIQAQSLQCREI